MGDPTFRYLRGVRHRVYEVRVNSRPVGSVTCTDADSRTWVARLGPEERRCLDSQGEEITFKSRKLAAAVLVAASDVPS